MIHKAQNPTAKPLAMANERKCYFLVMILLVDGLRSPIRGDHTKKYYNVIAQVPLATLFSSFFSA